VIVLGVTLVFVGLLLVNVAAWPRVRAAGRNDSPRDVAVLIPARNEEVNIAACLNGVLDQGDTVAEILVYDDHSTDRTADIVREYASHDARVRLLTPEPLPAGWCGKNHACWQLANAAEADWQLFLDADARLQPNAVMRMRVGADTRGTLHFCPRGRDWSKNRFGSARACRC
jgi:glycosyltransferase involved in cell wall biosynthesis